MSKETNVEFITRIMQFSGNGALMQAFVIDCLDKWSSIIANKSDAELEEAFNNSQVNWRRWKACAKEVQQELDNR